MSEPSRRWINRYLDHPDLEKVLNDMWVKRINNFSTEEFPDRVGGAFDEMHLLAQQTLEE